MSTAKEQIYTIGYQNRSVDGLIAELRERHVQLVVDVRSRAVSGRPEWCQRELHRRLVHEDITYVHEPRLGGDGEPDRFAAAIVVGWMRESELTVCLLCKEADPMDCHRSTALEPLFQACDVTLVHIPPAQASDLRAVSVRGDWADLIVDGKKTIETRTWRTKHRGETAIHKSGPDGGHIIGVVDISDVRRCHGIADEIAACCACEDKWGWILDKAARLAEPVPIRGRRGVWPVPADVAQAVRAQL